MPTIKSQTAKMSSESVEYKTMASLHGAFNYICKIATITLCKEFHKEKLISYDLLVMCKENLDENEDFAEKVAEQLQQRVKLDPAAFCHIQEVLRRTTGVDFMQNKLKKRKRSCKMNKSVVLQQAPARESESKLKKLQVHKLPEQEQLSPVHISVAKIYWRQSNKIYWR